MKLSFIGAGYIGLINGICFAELGNQVLFIDNNTEVVSKLKNNKLPIYESNLDILFQKNIKLNRLFFASNIRLCVGFSKIIFVTLPTNNYMSNIINIINYIIKYNVNKERKIIINRSTVPVGTIMKLNNYLISKKINYIDIVSNPEFLREGDAIYDFMNPSRIIIGSNNTKSIIKIKKLYSSFISKKIPFIITNSSNAELIKYICNAFLATKISFINEISKVCEYLNININNILYSIGLDKRIGNKYLTPGFGFGGGCLIKDVKYLIDLGSIYNNKLKLLKSVIDINYKQRYIFYKKIVNYFNYNLCDKKIVIWGGAFKYGTDDIRNSPSVYLINKLLKLQCNIYIFDPISIIRLREKFKNKIKYSNHMYNVLNNADCLIITTDYLMFKHIDYNIIISKMRCRVIFDAKNILNTRLIKKHQFHYESIGNKIL